MVIGVILSLLLLSNGSADPGNLEQINYVPTLSDEGSVSIATEYRLPPILDKIPQKRSESLGLDVDSRAALVWDVDSEAALFQKNADQSLSIASITKLMTAVVFLENNPGWDKVVAPTYAENSLIGAKLFINNGESVRVEDLFYSSLVGSANNATSCLAHSTELSEEEFVQKMNEKAQELGMTNSHFADPTGLDPENRSTVKDIAKLAKFAFNIPEISKGTTMTEHLMVTVNNGAEHRVRSWNNLLKYEPNFPDEIHYQITGSKTGYLDEALYCLVTEAKDQDGNEVISVVLGNPDDNDRFHEGKALLEWAFANYEWID